MPTRRTASKYGTWSTFLINKASQGDLCSAGHKALKNWVALEKANPGLDALEIAKKATKADLHGAREAYFDDESDAEELDDTIDNLTKALDDASKPVKEILTTAIESAKKLLKGLKDDPGIVVPHKDNWNLIVVRGPKAAPTRRRR